MGRYSVIHGIRFSIDKSQLPIITELVNKNISSKFTYDQWEVVKTAIDLGWRLDKYAFYLTNDSKDDKYMVYIGKSYWSRLMNDLEAINIMNLEEIQQFRSFINTSLMTYFEKLSVNIQDMEIGVYIKGCD